MQSRPLVSFRGVRKYFPIRTAPWQPRQFVRALDGIDLEISPGETLGLVGESGSGKSTLGRTLVRLEIETEGAIEFDGVPLDGLRGQALQAFRRRVQMIFQDPYSSLNPRMTVGEAIAEPLRIHGLCASAREARDRVAELLEKVGLQPEMADAHPHAFSGGQRQRIGIARALGLEPGLLICDEAVSALDVSVQAQILNLFNRLKHDLSLTYLFISHDLAVIRHVADRVAVMYLGQVVEIAPADELFSAPAHPYTRALVASKPAVRGTGPIRRVALRGEIPSPINPPSGCRFHTRCPDARSSCREEAPLLKRIGPDRLARCHLVEDMTSARVDPVSRIDPLAHAQSGGPPPC